MKEARVECMCVAYDLPDLGLRLHREQVVWLDAERARGSRHLAQAVQIGAVQVRWAQRCEVTKPAPPPPWLKRKVVPRAPPMPDVGDVARRVVVEARDELRDIVREEIRAALGAVRSDASAIRDVVRDAIREQGVSRPLPVEGGRGLMADGNVVSMGSNEPMYIPSGIVPTGESVASISVKDETTSGEGVTDASAALRAARVRRKPKES